MTLEELFNLILGFIEGLIALLSAIPSGFWEFILEFIDEI